MDTENTTAVETAPVEDTRTDAQKKAAEILAARAAGKPTKADVQSPKVPKEKKERPPAAPKGNIGYRFLRDLDPATDKLNNQQSVLMDAMLGLRKTEGELKDVFLRKDLLEKVTMEDLKSRQPTERVFGFYLNSWKKNIEATDKKAAIPALLEVVKIVDAPVAPVAG